MRVLLKITNILFSGPKASGAVTFGQSSKAEDLEGTVLLNVQPLSVLHPLQTNPAETKGSGNEKAADAVMEPNAELIRKETDSSPAGKKRGAEFLDEGPYYQLQYRGFKIHKVGKPAFGADDGEEETEEEEDQDTLGQTSKPTVTAAEAVTS